jgi:acetyl esterase
MTTRHLIDPEVLPILELMPTRDFDAAVLAEVRGMTESRLAFLGEPPILPDVRTIAGPDGPLEVYLYDPAPGVQNRPALLHIHGGGMVIGSAAAMQHGPSGVAAALGIPVASVEYRLAPEHPFPAPQEDCYAALLWLAGEAAALGVDPARIGVMGESAGGGLAAAVALMARDLAGPKLVAQVLTYPMLDHRTGSADCQHNNAGTGEFMWTRTSNQFGWGALRGDYAAEDHRKGWFSPALAENMADLAPAWIGTGSLDLFLDENLAYARRLIDAGVATELHVYPGGVHAFNALPEAQIAKAFSRDLLSAAARLLGVNG